MINFTVSVLGGWHPKTAKELAKLGGVLVAHTGKERWVVVVHLIQRLGVSLVRGHTPQFPRAHVDRDVDQSEEEGEREGEAPRLIG